MLALIGLAFALLAGLAIIGMVLAIIGAVVRFVAIVGLAGAIATSVGLGFRLAGTDLGPAVLIGLLAFPFAIWLLRRRRRTQSPVHSEPDVGPALAYSGPAESAADAVIGAAWEELADMVPRGHTIALFETRAACVEVLRLAGSTAIDLDLVACAAFIRRNVPELAVRNARLWACDDAAGRAALSQGIVEDVARLGAYARRELDRATLQDRRADRDGLTALRLHIAARADG